MTVALRPMTPADFAPLAAWIATVPLWQRYGVTETGMIDNFTAAHQRHDILIVADEETRPACGFAWVIPRGAFGRSAYLRLIGVHPAASARGIGSMLLAHAEQESARHAGDLFLLVSDFNTDAQRFYQRHGYTQTGAIAGYVVPDVVELLFWKRLSPQRS